MAVSLSALIAGLASLPPNFLVLFSVTSQQQGHVTAGKIRLMRELIHILYCILYIYIRGVSIISGIGAAICAAVVVARCNDR
jgi:hypothetical protein